MSIGVIILSLYQTSSEYKVQEVYMMLYIVVIFKDGGSIYLPIQQAVGGPLEYCAFLIPCGTNTNSSSSASNINILNKYMSLWAAPFSVRNSTTANFSSNATISGPKEKSKIEAEAVQVSRKKAAEERLPPGIVVRESDLHLRRLWGNPTSDVASGKQYLLTMSVGYTEKANVNATIHKLSDKFDIVLFHYDGRTSEWEEFEWSKKVVHVSARKQAKWWFAKRFLHPSIVAAYEYVFVWDEDLGVDNFTAEEYISIVRKHALDISQPGLDGTKGRRQYPVTVRRPSGDMHNSGRFVENDLVHGWGLDFNFWRCVHEPEKHIGVVDAQFVVHRGVPTLLSQGNGEQDGSSAKLSKSRSKMKAASSIFTALSAAVFGFFIGISFPVEITPKLQYCAFLPCDGTNTNSSSSSDSNNNMLNFWAPSVRNSTSAPSNATISGNGTTTAAAAVAKKPQGAERLPPGIVVRDSDLHLHRLWGHPTSDVASGKQYLVTLTVGYTEKDNINATVHKLSDKFDIVLFHYDGRTTEWEEFEWSKKVVHVSAKKQTKWWFAKRFMHPSIVAPYEYIFLWDEDLGVDNFSAEEYISIARKHGLGISQPGLDATKGKRSRYTATARRPAGDMHTSGRFVEVMAPVFSRDAWACVWHMIPASNDLVHGWGLDHNFWRCVDEPEEHIGVVDAQFVVHRGVPTLISQGNGEQEGSSAKVRSRQFDEMRTFYRRIADAEKAQADATAAAADHHR
uniref:Uncharacterized protein n=1 Tax=Oryza rufipogon TaxID=4529 RepID=A0A0E0Q2V8_ORYRU